MARRRILAFALTTLAAFAPATAQQPGSAPAPAQQPPVPVEDIDAPEMVVTGRLEEARRTVIALTAESGYQQLARFEEPLCPGVSGLPQNYAAVLVGIVRSNAQRAGLRVLPENCAPNAIATFVAEPTALMTGWQNRNRSVFGLRTDGEIAALTARREPVISWRVSETRRYDGAELDRADGVDTGQGATSTSEPIYVVRQALASRNEQNVRQDVRMAFAVIDRDAIAGKSLQQLADLVTMHLLLDLAEGAARRAGPNSILSLLETPAGAAAPQTLSAVDRGMLAGLYGLSRNNLTVGQQRGAMLRAIRSQTQGQ